MRCDDAAEQSVASIDRPSRTPRGRGTRDAVQGQKRRFGARGCMVAAARRAYETSPR